MIRKLIYVSLVVLFFAGCSEDEPPADSRATVFYREDSLISLNSVHVTLDDGNTVWNFEPHNFRRVAPDSNLFASPEVQTAASGTLKLEFYLVHSDTVVFSDGSLTTYMSPNWRWSFEIVHTTPGSPYLCNDCYRKTVYDIYDPAYPDDHVEIMWRGRGP